MAIRPSLRHQVARL